jgi:hypothetical protein
MVYTGTPNASSEQVLRRNGNNLELLDNGVLVCTSPAGDTSTVSLLEAPNATVHLTIDEDFGGAFVVPGGIFFQNAAVGDNRVVLEDTHGITGADTLLVTPTYGVLAGVQLISYTYVTNVIADGGPQGRAYLFGRADPGAPNTFISLPTTAALGNNNFTSTVNGFGVVSAFGSAADTAQMKNGGSNSVFVGTPTYSYLSAGLSFNVASGFGSVRTTATGGSNLALLFGSPAGSNIFVAASANSYLKGPGFDNEVFSFSQVRGISYGSSNDIAALYDSLGNNLLRVTPTYSFMAAVDASYLNLALGFAQLDTVFDSSGTNQADLTTLPNSPPVVPSDPNTPPTYPPTPPPPANTDPPTNNGTVAVSSHDAPQVTGVGRIVLVFNNGVLTQQAGVFIG